MAHARKKARWNFIVEFILQVSDLKYDPKIGFVIPNVRVTDSTFLNCEASYDGNDASVPYMIQIIVNREFVS